VIVVVLGIFAVSLAIDLVMDLGRQASFLHAVVEGLTIIAAAIGVVLGARRLRAAANEAQDLRAQTRTLSSTLEATRRDAESWRREAAVFLCGLGVAIEQQFERWGLSGAEKEIALLLLKGFEHKEIAELRNVSETTVRQQARSVYRKGGLSGRHDLAAFFLEDLLAPRPAGNVNAASKPSARSA
jgi:DNA-binding CsgD family transcriptional regulator/outer membrane murein-binding lipoprotein Lpp